MPDKRDLIKIAQELLNIEKNDISIRCPDTSIVPDTGPSILSRNIPIVSRLLEQCMKSIQKKRFRAPLPLEETRSFQRTASEEWDEEDFSGYPFIGMSWGSCVTEVEFDPVTLEASVRGVWLAIDCGRIIDENNARRSVETEVVNALNLISANTVYKTRQGEKGFPEYQP